MNNIYFRIIGINLVVYALLYLLLPTYFALYFVFFFFGNLLLGWGFWAEGQREMAKAFWLAAFVVTLVGLGTCAIVLSSIRVAGPPPNS